MSVDILRKAAALMRERAEAAKVEAVDQGLNWWGAEGLTKAFDALGKAKHYTITGIAEDADHIASWHPAVALAVADSIEAVLTWFDPEDCTEAEQEMHDALLAVARAYLNEATQ